MHARFWSKIVKRPVGRPRRMWEDNIKMDLEEIVCENVDWIHVVQDGAGCCEHGNEPSGSIKCGEFLDQLSDCQLLKKNSARWS
jgi:hypothetical protein